MSGEGSCPDLVLVNRGEKKIIIMELTSPLEANIEAAYTRKATKYTPLKIDLEERGYSVQLVPFEIGSRGYVSTRNKNNLINIYVSNKINYNFLKLYKKNSARYPCYAPSLYFMHILPATTVTLRCLPLYTKLSCGFSSKFCCRRLCFWAIV